MRDLYMPIRKNTMFSRIKTNITTRFLSGMLLLIPFGVTLLIMRWLFGWVAALVRPLIIGLLRLFILIPFVDSLPDSLTTFCVAVLTIVILLATVYLLGEIGQLVLGKKIIHITEKLLRRIPLVRSIYTATKQVIEAVSLPNKTALKSVVIVEFPRPGFKAVGFLTGHIQEPSGKKLCKVFIPTTPNPTTGFFEIVPQNEVTETTLTVEEAFKMIISGGIVSPDSLCVTSQTNKAASSKQNQEKTITI